MVKKSHIATLAVALAFFLQSFAPIYASETLTQSVLGPELNLCTLPNCPTYNSNGSYWNWYNAGDAPEGAFMGWYNLATEMGATIILPQQLPAGSYKVFVKGYNYDGAQTVDISLADSTATTATNDRDWNKTWTVGVTVNPTQPTSTLNLNFKKTDPTTAKFLIRGVFITSDTDTLITSYDQVIHITPEFPTATASADYKGNIINNSSFETGTGHGWSLASNSLLAPHALLDTTTAWHGQSSIRIPATQSTNIYGTSISFKSKPYHVRPNKQHTLSGYVKTEPGRSFTGVVYLTNTFDPPSGSGAQRHSLYKIITITDQWTRFDLTGDLLAHPTSDYQVTLVLDTSANANIWLDGLQLEEGMLTNYQPKLPVELELSSTVGISNVYHESDKPRVKATLFNNSATAQQVQIQYSAIDQTNTEVNKTTLTVNAPPGKSVHDLKLSELAQAVGTKRGTYTVFAHIPTTIGSDDELVLSIIPNPIAGNELLGVHPNFTQEQLSIANRLGITWARVLSPSAFFRWSVVEPQDEQYIWYDTEINLAQTNGISVLGTIGTNNYWPAWADNNGMPDLDKWQDFVYDIATHYAGRVKAWEIWNEPQGTFSPEFYAQLLSRAVTAIEQASSETNTAAEIVAFGGSADPDYVQAVVEAVENAQPPQWVWSDHISTIGIHTYPTAEANVAPVMPIVESLNNVLWNTETGYWDLGNFLRSNASALHWGEFVYPFRSAERFYRSQRLSSEIVAVNFLSTIGDGVQKYFYYDSRYHSETGHPGTALQPFHPTYLEYDRSVRSKAATLSTLSTLLAGATGEGPINVCSDCQGYVYQANNKAIAALWSKNFDTKKIKITPTGIDTDKLVPKLTAQYVAYTHLGNKITPDTTGSVTFDHHPVLIVAQGKTTEELKTLLEANGATTIADTTPPVLNIFSKPTREIHVGDDFLFRYIAIDAVSVPEFNSLANVHPNAVLYSYRLTGVDTDWSSWSPKTVAEYTELPAGTFQFEVKAQDASGNISPVVTQTVNVLP